MEKFPKTTMRFPKHSQTFIKKNLYSEKLNQSNESY